MMRVMDEIRHASEVEFPADGVERSKKASEMSRCARIAGDDVPRLELPTERLLRAAQSDREQPVAIVLNATSGVGTGIGKR
jgi:hypothetical protein